MGKISLHSIMVDNYRAAKRMTDQNQYSDYWDRSHYSIFEDILKRESLWTQFHARGISEGMGVGRFEENQKTSPDRKITDREQVKRTVAEFNDLCSISGKDFVTDLLVSDIGAPPYVAHQDKRLVYFDLRHIYFAWNIYSHLAERRLEPLTIVEIGGGYGGLAEKLKRLFPNCRILIFDLPEANAIQTYFLNQTFPDTRFFYFEDLRSAGMTEFFDEKYEFGLLPPAAIAQLPPKSIDLFINIDSMMEMTSETIQSYFDAIHKAVRTGGVFYCVNRYQKSTTRESIRIKNYPFDAKWYFFLSKLVKGKIHIHELMAERIGRESVNNHSEILDNLPPFNLSDVWNDLQSAYLKLSAIVLGHGIDSGNPGIMTYVFGLGDARRNPFRPLRRFFGRIKRALNSST